MHDDYAAKSGRDEKSKKVFVILPFEEILIRDKQIIIGWINRQLANREMEITNLTTDLQDGVYLINVSHLNNITLMLNNCIV